MLQRQKLKIATGTQPGDDGQVLCVRGRCSAKQGHPVKPEVQRSLLVTVCLLRGQGISHAA